MRVRANAADQSCQDALACAAKAPAARGYLQFARYLAVLLVVCCTLTPWLQQQHASEHLLTPVEEISCQICQYGSLTDALASPLLMAAVSSLLYVILAAALPSAFLLRRIHGFSSRAPPRPAV